jgi:hypothetical protein
MQQLQATPNNVFLQPEFSTTAVPIAMGAGGLMALQNTGTGTVAGCNTALLTFNAAHGYTQTAQSNGTQLIQNPTTNHVPPNLGGSLLDSTLYLCFQLTGATGNTAVNGFTMSVLAIPSTTTMIVACPVTGTNPTVTGASFLPVFILQYGQYNLALGANCAVQYNPDNTGSPYTQQSLASNVVPAPTFRQLQAVSTTTQIESEGLAGQTIVIANGGAGTSRWSIYFR